MLRGHDYHVVTEGDRRQTKFHLANVAICRQKSVSYVCVAAMIWRMGSVWWSVPKHRLLRPDKIDLGIWTENAACAGSLSNQLGGWSSSRHRPESETRLHQLLTQDTVGRHGRHCVALCYQVTAPWPPNKEVTTAI